MCVCGGGEAEPRTHLGVLTGVDDLPLPVHDPIDGDPRNDVGLDEFQPVDEHGRGSRELGLLVQGGEFLLPKTALGTEQKCLLEGVSRAAPRPAWEGDPRAGFTSR